jgi:prevent-host-death family protein
MSATDVARSFADVLDTVEREGETILIVRRGRAVARLAPAVRGVGAEVKALLRRAPRDRTWPDELRELRASLQAEDRRWHD